MDLDPLFQPFRHGTLNLANRFVMAPMGRNFAQGGVIGEAYGEYYARRARGGVALSVGEAAAINHPVASTDIMHANFFGEAALAAWRKVIEAVHAVGGAFMPQIWHAGTLRGPAGSDMMPNGALPPIGPSGWGEPLVNSFGWINAIDEAQSLNAPMSETEIADVIAAFGQAAADARAIGADGVQIHAAHGYLVDQFFWDRTNRRKDGYNGGVATRTRFAAEVVRECRRRAGPDFPLVFRWSQWKQQDYSVKLAQDPHELESFLAPLADAGVDIFDCSTRRYWEPEFEGSALNLAGWTKKITGKPTMTVGSIGLDRSNWLEGEAASISDAGIASIAPLAERVDAGEFDLVAIGRALIANPEMPLLLREGRAGELKAYSNEALMSLD